VALNAGPVLLKEEEICGAFVEVWRVFCEQVAPLHNRPDWDVVRIEFWTENGKVVIHPCSTAGTQPTPPAVLEATIPSFREYAYERIHSEIPSEIAEEELEAMERNLAAWISLAAQRANLAALLCRPAAKLIYCMPNDDEFFHEATIFQ